MRVLHLTDSFKTGGVTTVIRELALTQQEHGHEVLVGRLQSSGNQDVVEDVHVVSGRSLISELLRADVVHCHHRRAGLVANVLRGRGVVDHVHNRHSNYSLISFRGNVVVAVSNELAKYTLNRFPHVADRLEVVLNGSRAPLVPALNERSRIQSQIGTESIRLIGVGRVTEQKQPLQFVAVVARLRALGKNVLAQWIGEGELQDEMDAMARNAGISDCFTRRSWLSRPATLEAMQSSDICLLTSAWEGLPMVGIEALSVGTPAISSSVGDFSSLLESSEPKWVYDRQFTESAVTAVLRVAEDIERSPLSVRRSAVQIWREQFSLDSRMESWDRVYAKSTC